MSTLGLCQILRILSDVRREPSDFARNFGAGPSIAADALDRAARQCIAEATPPGAMLPAPHRHPDGPELPAQAARDAWIALYRQMSEGRQK